MAYQADILINVKGFRDLATIQKALEGTARKIDEVNKAAERMNAPVRSLQRFTKELQRAKKALDVVAIGSPQERRAINNYVTAVNNANVARSHQNKLIQEETQRRNSVINAIRANVEANVAESRSIRAAREEASRLNRELVERNRLERNLSKRGLMQLRSGAIAKGTDAGLGFIGPAMPKGFMTRKATQAAAKREQAAASAAQRAGNKVFESLMLGAGFPILFGGGIGEILGGTLGSFAPGGGFGGQILGSAIGRILNDFADSAAELGNALNSANPDFDVLVDRLGGGATAAAQYIRALEDLGKKQEALAVATAALGDLVGKEGVDDLKEFGEDAAQLGRVFALAMTQMQASVAGVINSVGILKALVAGLEYNVLLRQALKSEDPGQRRRTEQREQADRGILFGGDPAKFKKLSDELVAAQRKINEEKNKELLAQKEIVTTAERHKTQLKEIKEALDKYNSALKLSEQSFRMMEAQLQSQIDALDRGARVADSRYSAEAALNDLLGAQLERHYELAKTADERYIIAIKMFHQQVEAARIEYEQALNTNRVLVQRAVLQARLVELKLQEYEAAKKIAIATAKSRGADPEVIAELAAGYNEGIALQKIAVQSAYEQVTAVQQIAENQDKVAEAVFKTKVLQAESALQQKLVSKEIGMSTQEAENLTQRLGEAAQKVIETKDEVNRVVGVITTANTRTLIWSQSTANLAANARNAAININAAAAAQERLNVAQRAKSGGKDKVQKAAKGAYMKGGFQAFANGGFVSRPTLGLVGEGSDDEYIVPSKKARGFAMNYLGGARGAAAIPSSPGRGGNASGPVTVNVRTGPVMEQGGTKWVTLADMENALAQFGDSMTRQGRTYAGRRYVGTV